MKDITGSQHLIHERSVVFSEGLNAYHWEHRTDLFRIQPLSERMGQGEKVHVSLHVPTITTDFTAEVISCVENQYVSVQGSARHLGNFGLSIALFDGLEPATTRAEFRLGIKLGGFAMLGGRAIERLLQHHLHNELDPYIERLSGSISTAISATHKKQGQP